VVVVACAGNNGQDVYGPDNRYGTSDDSSPAAFPEVVTVSALASDYFAPFSNYSRTVVPWNPVVSKGKAIDIAAPGVGIHSTWLNGGYASKNGTSQAAAHVSGAFALLIKRLGRDVNKDGKINGEDVAIFRQLLIDLSLPQNQWSRSSNDPDSNPEGMLNLRGI
jgi:subtilisin family serine protease